MKVLLVTHQYPPEHIGGTETYTHGLAKGLQAAGHEVQVLCAEGWERGRCYWNGSSDVVYDGVPVRRLHLNWTKAPDPNLYLYYNPVVEHYLPGYLAEVQPDVVHVTSCNTLSASVISAAKRAGRPVVVTLTDFWFLCPQVTLLKNDGTLCDGRTTEWECLECLWRGAKAYRWSKQLLSEPMHGRLLTEVSWRWWLTRWRGLRGMALDIGHRRATLHQALLQADRVLIASQGALGLFQLNRFSRQIDVVPYGHDLSWLESYTGKTPSKQIRFGFIGQIEPMKGPQVLIEAFQKMNHNSESRLFVYGDLMKNPFFGHQLELSAGGREEIEFRGTYPHSESGRVFADIDILVVPSLWYDYPLIINEGFATQTPVVATNIAGMGEMVRHDVNGLLFERGSKNDLARQLSRLIDEPGLLARLRAGIPRVKRMEEAVLELVGIYHELGNLSR